MEILHDRTPENDSRDEAEHAFGSTGTCSHPHRDVKGSKICKQDGIPALTARLILGAIFIYASIDKIVHPEAFAKAVYNYQVLPDVLINVAAIVLPWLELFVGVALILRVWLPGAAFMSSLLLLIFFGVLVFNLARGLDIHCGCFNTSQEASSSLCMCLYVIRDGIFLLPAFYLLYHTFRERMEALKV